MSRTKSIRRILSIFLLISLLCTNISPALLGLISYALDNEEETEVIEQKALGVEISEFNKNKMLESETEYSETLSVNLGYETEFNKFKISDISTKISNGEELEENEEDEKSEEVEEVAESVDNNIKTFYKTTKINKENLTNVIGTFGSLEIDYKELVLEEAETVVDEEEKILDEVAEIEEKAEETIQTENVIEKVEEVEESTETETAVETENNEEEVYAEIPVGTVIATDGKVTITAETEADEEGYITIVYPENTVLVDFTVLLVAHEVEDLKIVNVKAVDIVTDLEEVKQIEVVKNITVNTIEENENETFEIELLNEDTAVTMPIQYSKSIAELGIDKSQISTSVENNVSLTVTMFANSLKYDLYKNPYFVIELPSEIKSVNINNAVIINNNIFEAEAVLQGTYDNGNNAIAIKLNGEQTEYNNSIEENIQMVFNLTLVTEESIPTLDREIVLHYTNENATTYNGVEVAEEGTSIVPIQLVSNSEVIVETKAILGETVTTSLRNNYNVVTVEPNTYSEARIIGKAINNTEADLTDASILVSARSISKISGFDEVYYTENENASSILNDAENLWTSIYTENAKKALIVLPEFAKGQTVEFTYIMSLLGNNEIDLVNVAKFEVYNNDEIISESAITINQVAEAQEVVEERTVSAKLIVDKHEVAVGEKVTIKVEINNNTDQDIEKARVNIKLPDTMENSDASGLVNGQNRFVMNLPSNEVTVGTVSLKRGECTTVEIIANVKEEYTESESEIVATLIVGENSAQFSDTVKVLEPSKIETTITSNKVGMILHPGDSIEYKITIKNAGESYANVDVDLPELDNLCVQKIRSVNLNTGKEQVYTSGDLKIRKYNIYIGAGETIESTIYAIVKDLEEETTETIFANVSALGINDTKTKSISNNIKEQDETEDISEVIKTNDIKGIAWIDKNGNGRKDEKEVLLKGIQANLINTEKGIIVATDITNNKGEYEFKDLPEGKYVVEFNYNNTTFEVTDYKKETVEDELDSDIINTTQGNKTTSKSEVILLKEGKTENVNAGFITNRKFDLSINKGITKVTTNNSEATESNNYSAEKNVETKIKRDLLKNALLLVEYEIEVTNTGDIAGYAKVISDKIPEGMTFNSELNTSWYEGNDGKIYSVTLANKEIQPGETVKLKLVLTKEVQNETELTIVNTVSIEQTFNEYLVEEKTDSNNYSEATLSVKAQGRRK